MNKVIDLADYRDGPFAVALVECHTCGHRCMSVYPVSCDDAHLECPHCHAMSAESIQVQP